MAKATRKKSAERRQTAAECREEAPLLAYTLGVAEAANNSVYTSRNATTGVAKTVTNAARVIWKKSGRWKFREVFSMRGDDVTRDAITAQRCLRSKRWCWRRIWPRKVDRVHPD